MNHTPPPLQAQYEFSREDFDAIAAFAQKHFGLNLPETKISLVYSRLARRLRALKLNNFQDYRAILESHEETGERQELLSALTTNVTKFFREPHHFETFRSVILPPLLEQAQLGKRVRFWSAGCSTGPEPYSMAMCILDQCPNAASLDIRILATDIDPVVVETAEMGVYPVSEIENVPAEFRKLHISANKSKEKTIQMSQATKELIRFGVLNLIESFPFTGKFDTIFCRNVAIYFKRSTQDLVWAKLSAALHNGGTLFIGHSERLSGDAASAFTPTGITTYRKN